MKINDKLKFSVAEPWNFSSSDGDNLFYCTIIDLNQTDKRDLYLAKTLSHFEISNRKVDFVILQIRDYQNSNNYNIYIFKDNYDINVFSGDKDIRKKIDFRINGSLK